MAYHQDIGEWHGKTLVDRHGERIGKLEDVYVDVETNEPMFGTVKEGLIARHLTFAPLAGITKAATSSGSSAHRAKIGGSVVSSKSTTMAGNVRATVMRPAEDLGIPGSPAQKPSKYRHFWDAAGLGPTGCDSIESLL